MSQQQAPLPLPDKKIPFVVMIIGTFELVVAMFGLIVLVLVGQMNGVSMALLILLLIYGAMGAGLWAIQEWARSANVLLHIVAIPYSLYTALVLDGPSGWQLVSQLVIAAGIVFALTRPELRHKFQTVVPKKRNK